MWFLSTSSALWQVSLSMRGSPLSATRGHRGQEHGHLGWPARLLSDTCTHGAFRAHRDCGAPLSSSRSHTGAPDQSRKHENHVTHSISLEGCTNGEKRNSPRHSARPWEMKWNLSSTLRSPCCPLSFATCTEHRVSAHAALRQLSPTVSEFKDVGFALRVPEYLV